MNTATNALAQSHSASDPGQKFDTVKYIERLRAFAIRMQNGRAYTLKLDDLPEADRSPVLRCRASKDRYYFKAFQESGNVLEVPWDSVLYHCEPEYEYYKYRQRKSERLERAVRIGETVREFRTGKKLTVTQLAEHAQMQRTNLSRLEHGRHVPSLETIERLASALGVPVASLISYTGRPKTQKATSSTHAE